MARKQIASKSNLLEKSNRDQYGQVHRTFIKLTILCLHVEH